MNVEEIYKAVYDKGKELGRYLEVEEIINVALEKFLEDEEGRKCYEDSIRATSKMSNSISNEKEEEN